MDEVRLKDDTKSEDEYDQSRNESRALYEYQHGASYVVIILFRYLFATSLSLKPPTSRDEGKAPNAAI